MSLYSFRMRASANKTHLAGAERIINGEHFENVLTEIIWRGITSYVPPNQIIVTVDPVNPDSVICIKSLDIRTITSSSCDEASIISKNILMSNRISIKAIEKAFQLLASGPAPESTNMRGAIIMDAFTGERIEPDMTRGVRVSRIDYTDDAGIHLSTMLREYRIFHRRVMDALAIATKVSYREETVAELCWSDNPDYTTGYVASKDSGYIRITNMKERGALRGGRVFFVDRNDMHLEQYIHYLEKQPVLINRIGDVLPCHPEFISGSRSCLRA